MLELRLMAGVLDCVPEARAERLMLAELLLQAEAEGEGLGVLPSSPSEPTVGEGEVEGQADSVKLAELVRELRLLAVMVTAAGEGVGLPVPSSRAVTVGQALAVGHLEGVEEMERE